MARAHEKSPGEGQEVKSDSRFYSGVYSAAGEPWLRNGQRGREKLEHGNVLCAVAAAIISALWFAALTVPAA